MMTQMLMGAGSSFRVNDLTNVIVSKSGTGGTVISRATYLGDGRINNIDGVTVDNWGSPTTSGAGAAYWVRATLGSGATPSGATLNTWHQLSGDPYWEIQRNTVGTNECVLDVQIASDSGGSNILDTHTLSIYVERTS